MQNAENYFAAAEPNTPRCIGLKLRPYSLGHHVLLHAYNSSFLTSSDPTFADLIFGVFICSQSWRGWAEWKDSWKFPVFLKLWGWIQRRFNIEREATAFREYLIAGSRTPELVVPAAAESLNAPWEPRLKMFLVEKFKLTAEEAMDYPLALAWQEYCAHAEAEGRLKLLGESDEKAFELSGSDELQAMLAQAKADHLRETEAMRKN